MSWTYQDHRIMFVFSPVRSEIYRPSEASHISTFSDEINRSPNCFQEEPEKDTSTCRPSNKASVDANEASSNTYHAPLTRDAGSRSGRCLNPGFLIYPKIGFEYQPPLNDIADN